MEISACNSIDGTVTSMKKGKATTDLRMSSAIGELALVVTSSAVEALALAPGDTVVAYFREIDVMLTAGGGTISTKNRFPARVVGEVKKGNVTAEFQLALAGGRTITAVVARAAAEDMGLAPGSEVLACVREGDLLLAKGGQLSVRNRSTGTITDLRPGTVTTEVTVAVEGGTVQALLARSTAEAMRLAMGDRVQALSRERDTLLAR
ncbi:MAG: hypothetical protein FJY47_02700 [Betaproteobacteria bacterium]|nr:hypothetical protein [Betaproteobacteria bacterium]MBM3354732.1 hypothetical protein [Betaproteobacteria bacterium]MBM3384601.1 hypothetical protein [Betaproteobacteria bacterium]